MRWTEPLRSLTASRDKAWSLHIPHSDMINMPIRPGSQQARSGTDVGRLGKARSRRSNSSQRCSEVEVRVLCRPVKFFHTNLDKLFLYGYHCNAAL